MLPSISLPPTISQMSLTDREKFSRHGGMAWMTERILLKEPFDPSKKAWEYTDSYESAIKGNLFRQCVSSLQSEDIWFDAGCGQGSALIQYVQEYAKGANVHGVTLTRPSKQADEDKMINACQKYNRLHLYFHDVLSFPTTSLQGRVRMITDIYGAFNYCGKPSEVLAKFAAMLTVGGTLFLKFGSSNTVNVTMHKKAIYNKELLARGSAAFFYLYLSTVRGFKVIAPKDVSPASISKLYSITANIYERSTKGYDECSWIMIRTEEPFDADALYVEGEKVQCDDSIASTEKFRKYHWEISDKNKEYIENMKEVTI